MTDVIPIRSVAIGGAPYQVQPILSLTSGATTFWLSLELRRPDSPTGRFIAGIEGPTGSSAWVTSNECPRAVIGEIDGPEGEGLREEKIPSIDDIEKSARRQARQTRAEWRRLWSGGHDAEARVQKAVAHSYDELHRLIRIARIHRMSATLRGDHQDILRG
ncbi:hypothetical protein [Paracoccus sp. SSK6]|uniref:hypothetical protein n=1 Tax=Paracoccus sp. SSK6 TaxID=3143131 RepID=UPI00321ADCC7